MKRTSIGIWSVAVLALLILSALLYQGMTRPLVSPANVVSPTVEAQSSPSPVPQTSASPSVSSNPSGTSKLKLLFSNEGQPAEVVIELLPSLAPKTVAHITELVQKGFYNGLKFDRVVPGFLVSGGNPHSGGGIAPELSATPQDVGTVGLARGADPNSGDSQFYILLSRQPNLDQRFTVFGRVVSGMESVQKIKVGTPFTASLF